MHYMPNTGPMFRVEPALSGGAPRVLDAVVEAHECPLFEALCEADVGPISMAEAREALKADASARRILAKGTPVRPGMYAGSRLNLNVLKATGVPVMTIHAPTNNEGHRRGRGWYRGRVMDYRPVVVLEDAYFNVHQPSREKIASGAAPKMPMASVDGVYVGDSTADWGGVPVRFNPKTSHLFACVRGGYAIRHAERAVLFGHRVYCQGRITFYRADEAPAPAGDAPSDVRFVADYGDSSPEEREA